MFHERQRPARLANDTRTTTGPTGGEHKELACMRILLDKFCCMCNTVGMAHAPTPSDSPPTSGAIEEIAQACLAVRARMLARAVSTIYERTMARCGMTISQVNILVSVGMLGPCSPGEIGRTLYMERSTVSRNIDRLIEQGLLDAEATSKGRVRALRITAQGVRGIERALPDWRRAQKRAATLMGEGGTQAIHRLGGRLFRAASPRQTTRKHMRASTDA